MARREWAKERQVSDCGQPEGGARGPRKFAIRRPWPAKMIIDNLAIVAILLGISLLYILYDTTRKIDRAIQRV
jgi:hypothetical protein